MQSSNQARGSNQGSLSLSKLLSPRTLFITSSVILVFVLLDLQFFKLFSRTEVGNIIEFVSTRFWPPETSPRVTESIILAILETIQMAFIATYFGTILSIPFSLLASYNITSPRIASVTRIVLVFIRTIPSLIWALLFVILFGLGPRSGAMALSFYTMGYLSKFQFETFEGLSTDAIEAITALGANKLQIIRHVVLPETGNQLISQIIFMFEYNIRAGSIIGFVGAGGIGFLLSLYLGFFQFQALLTAILFLVVVIVAVDLLSGLIRKQFFDPNFDELNV